MLQGAKLVLAKRKVWKYTDARCELLCFRAMETLDKTPIPSGLAASRQERFNASVTPRVSGNPGAGPGRVQSGNAPEDVKVGRHFHLVQVIRACQVGSVFAAPPVFKSDLKPRYLQFFLWRFGRETRKGRWFLNCLGFKNGRKIAKNLERLCRKGFFRFLEISNWPLAKNDGSLESPGLLVIPCYLSFTPFSSR